MAGLRLAKSPSPARSPRSPFSGRMEMSSGSHLGPPTAPSSTASASRAMLRVTSGRGRPVASMAAPPTRASSMSMSRPKSSRSVARTLTASVTISGPIPSPGRMRMFLLKGLYLAQWGLVPGPSRHRAHRSRHSQEPKSNG